MLVLLSEYYAVVFDSFARHLQKMAVIGTQHTPHLYCALQLLGVTFTEGPQIANRQDINAAPNELSRNLNIQLFVKIEAKVCRWQCVHPSACALS